VGLLDSLLGRTKPVRPNLDALFALPSAAVTLQSASGLVLSGRAGVCWMPPAGQSAADIQHEIADLLEIPDNPADAGQATAEASGGDTTAGTVVPSGAGKVGMLSQAEDAYGYRWLLLDDADVEDLVSRVHLVNSTLAENGWGPQLLCSVFGVVPAAGADSTARPFYLVYLFKRGTFYPFAPEGRQRRDTELELRIRALLGSDLPVEQDVSRWFPLWDLPVR
jgi:hypothetical protein